jgi:ubiquinone/menaquinone biosynthesis C-methylase UbiE
MIAALKNASSQAKAVEWNAYARCYDLLCAINPAYTELLEEFAAFIRKARTSVGARILDLGGGTGNFFSYALPAEIAKSSQLIHLDSDARMIAIAEHKYQRRGINVRTITKDAGTQIFFAASFDCIVSVNAIYAMPSPELILRKTFHWLRPGGRLLLIDLGRTLDSADWRSFLLKANIRNLGLIPALRILLNEGRVIAKANGRIARAQLNGTFWTHTTEEMRQTLEQIGYKVEEARQVYRGYCDLAVATKPA